MAFNLGAIASQMGQTVMIILGIVIVLAFITGIFVLHMMAKQYRKYKVIVFKRFKNTSGQEMLYITDLKERGAVKKDRKVNKWMFHLKSRNLDMGQDEGNDFDEERDIDIPSIPYAGGGEVVFVEEIAKRNYAFAQPVMVEGKITLQVSTADVAEAMRSYDMHVKTFARKDNALLAFAMYIVFAVLILILIVVVLNKLEALQSFGDKWLEGAKIMSGSAPLSDVAASTVPG